MYGLQIGHPYPILIAVTITESNQTTFNKEVFHVPVPWCSILSDDDKW